ncbi:MAG: methyltransferase domain-containing protein [Clostridia bacterium]|nr:methyltransferase domain-containing protein [Clostridia bacterium]
MEVRTIDYYNKNAKEYSQKTFDVDMSKLCDKFLNKLKPEARILDLGCGSGRDSQYFLSRGFDVYPVDGSKALCKIASQNIGIEVKELLFDELDFHEEFDGVWACASLLHVPKPELPAILTKVHQTLKDDGIFFVCFKYGDGEEVREGKHYTDMTEEVLQKVLQEHGFEILDLFITGDSIKNRDETKWVNAIGKRK